MCIFVYVPAAGSIAPAIFRNRVGPLFAQSTNIGGRVRARGGYLSRHGASFPGDTPAIIQARA